MTKPGKKQAVKKEEPANGVRIGSHGPKLYTLEVFLIDGPLSKDFTKKKKNRVVSRTIQMRSDQTLAQLHECIFNAFDRFDEHLYEFQVGGKGPMDPKARSYGLPSTQDGGPGMHGGRSPYLVTETHLGQLGLCVGDIFGYWFDFGDDWWHQVNLIAIDDEIPAGKYPREIARQGESPPQYPEDEEEE